VNGSVRGPIFLTNFFTHPVASILRMLYQLLEVFMSAQPAFTPTDILKAPEVKQPESGSENAILDVAGSTYSASNQKDYLKTFQPIKTGADLGLPGLSLTGLDDSSSSASTNSTEKSAVKSTGATSAPENTTAAKTDTPATTNDTTSKEVQAAPSTSSSSTSDTQLSSTLQAVVNSLGLKADLSGPVVDNITGFGGAGTTAKPLSEYGKPDGNGGFIIDNDPSHWGGDLAPTKSVTGEQLLVADVKFDPSAIKAATFDGGKMTSWPAVWGLSGVNKGSNLNQEVDAMEYFGQANKGKPAGSTLHDWIAGDHAGSKSYSAAINPALFDDAATKGVEIGALVNTNNDTVTTYVDGVQTEKFQLKAGDPALTTPMSWILGSGNGESMDVTNVQIYTPGKGASSGGGGTPESAQVLSGAADLSKQLNYDVGDLNGNYRPLTSLDDSIVAQDKKDVASNGGDLTSAQYKQLTGEESSLTSQISKDNYGYGDAQFQAAHGYRSAVLGKDATLANQINKDDGHLNGHYFQLLGEDNSIRQQEQTDAQANGLITGAQYQQLLSEESTLAQQITTDADGYGTTSSAVAA